MTCFASGTLCRARLGAFGMVLTLVLVACGQDGGSESATPLSSSATSVSPPASGGGPPTSDSPVISGTPVTNVVAGSAYAFTPRATDPSGTTLTFSVQNQPEWASFDPVNGALTGTPAAANVGTYKNIVISVSDGSASASLPAFSIIVNQISNGTASLTWTPVTKNTNGSALSDLAGYRVHYGTSASGMHSVVTLANPSLTNYLVTNLSSGTWYFGLTAYSTTGIESTLSNIGRKTIP
jgi:hypothetical protein